MTSIAPVCLALLLGYLAMPLLNVVRIDARGLGHERLQPWRRKIAAAIDAVRVSRLGRFFAQLSQLTEHPWFRPALGILALGILALTWHPKAALAAPMIVGSSLAEGQHAGEFLLEERESAGRPSRENITVLSGQNLKAGAVIGRVDRAIGRCSVPAVVGTGNGTMSKVFGGPEVLRGNYVVKCTAAVANGGTFSVTNPNGKALPALTLTAGSGNTTAYTSREINFSITDGSTDFVVNDSFTIVVDTTAPVAVGTGNGTISALSLGPDARPGNYQFVCTTTATNGGTFTVTGPNGDVLGIFAMTAGAGAATAFATRQINFTLTDGSTDFAAGDTFNVAVFNELSSGKVVAWDPTTFDGRHRIGGVLYDNVDATLADTAGVIIARDAAVRAADLQYATAITAAQQDSAALELASRLRIIAR